MAPDKVETFGAHMLIAKAKSLACDRRPYAVLIGDRESVSARTVVIALAPNTEYNHRATQNS
jgi:hypothetical protein